MFLARSTTSLLKIMEGTIASVPPRRGKASSAEFLLIQQISYLFVELHLPDLIN